MRKLLLTGLATLFEIARYECLQSTRDRIKKILISGSLLAAAASAPAKADIIHGTLTVFGSAYPHSRGIAGADRHKPRNDWACLTPLQPGDLTHFDSIYLTRRVAPGHFRLA